MSIAILPISQQFQWTSATIGLVQSSFFWGYLLTQVDGCAGLGCAAAARAELVLLCCAACCAALGLRCHVGASAGTLTAKQSGEVERIRAPQERPRLQQLLGSRGTTWAAGLSSAPAVRPPRSLPGGRRRLG